jgi:hypothetical protein
MSDERLVTQETERMAAEEDEPLEADEADTAEQRLGEPDEDDQAAAPVRDDVNPADAAEQHRSVPLDEDDYR